MDIASGKMNETDDYPFWEDVERRQQEPDDYPASGSSLFADTPKSPLAIERLPSRGERFTKDLTFNNRKETEHIK